MNTIPAGRIARELAAPNPTRPATGIVYDQHDVRLLVFRISPGQAVIPHHNASTVILTVLAGSGIVTGGDSESVVSAGDVVVYEPNERHGMHAVSDDLVLLATIAPSPGVRAAQPARGDHAAARGTV